MHKLAYSVVAAALAESLPKAIPANPHAPQLPPPVLGPDGIPTGVLPPKLPADAH